MLVFSSAFQLRENPPEYPTSTSQHKLFGRWEAVPFVEGVQRTWRAVHLSRNGGNRSSRKGCDQGPGRYPRIWCSLVSELARYCTVVKLLFLVLISSRKCCFPSWESLSADYGTSNPPAVDYKSFRLPLISAVSCHVDMASHNSLCSLQQQHPHRVKTAVMCQCIVTTLHVLSLNMQTLLHGMPTC